MSFYERSQAACVSRAFYTAYFNFIDNKPILRLILDGDWINFIRAYNRMSTGNQTAIRKSRTFSQLMIFGGAQTVRLLNAMGGIDKKHRNECANIVAMKFRCTATIHTSGRVVRVDDSAYIQDLSPAGVAGTILCERYDLLDQFIASTRLGPLCCHYSNDVADHVEGALIAFHQRCVPATRLCMIHHTHAELPITIPPVIIEMHSRTHMTISLLTVCIAAARNANNFDDEAWLRKKYPSLFFHALPGKLDTIHKCNIKHADLTDTFDILTSLDQKETIAW
jgi:hypothetical protein